VYSEATERTLKPQRLEHVSLCRGIILPVWPGRLGGSYMSDRPWIDDYPLKSWPDPVISCLSIPPLEPIIVHLNLITTSNPPHLYRLVMASNSQTSPTWIIPVQERREPPWAMDSVNSGPTSLAILLDWLSTGDNYTRWVTTGVRDPEREEVCLDVVARMQRHGIRHRTAMGTLLHILRPSYNNNCSSSWLIIMRIRCQ
jgi:hypothetical protein